MKGGYTRDLIAAEADRPVRLDFQRSEPPAAADTPKTTMGVQPETG